MKALIVCFILFAATAFAATRPRDVIPDLKERAEQLPSTVIDYDRNLLNDKEKQVVEKLIEASRYIDDIFWRMSSEENPDLRKELQSHPNPLALKYFDIMKGRWDRIHENQPFIAPFGQEGKSRAALPFIRPI